MGRQCLMVATSFLLGNYEVTAILIPSYQDERGSLLKRQRTARKIGKLSETAPLNFDRVGWYGHRIPTNYQEPTDNSQNNSNDVLPQPRLPEWNSDFIGFYSELLALHPLPTKSVTAAFIGGFGDVLAQSVELYTSQRAAYKSHPTFDLLRTLAIVSEGFLFSGPLMHYAYDALEKRVPVHTEDPDDGIYEWLAAAFHCIVDILVLDSVLVGALLLSSAIFEGRSSEIAWDMRDDYFAAVKVSWLSSALFAPLQCALIRHLRVDLRVLAMNVQDIMWNAAMSYMIYRSRA